MGEEFHIPERGERLLFIAPHPDDEALSAGGLIHEARRRGAEVTVAFLTSGDGFALGAAAHFQRWPDASTMRKFAAVREAEAARAASQLGLRPEDLRFLRYPDRGLATLWLKRWANPYASSYTGRTSACDTENRHPYTGEHFLRRVESLITEVMPELLLYPDPADDHPDHWAGCCFIRLAMERLTPQGEPTLPMAWTYLTHRGFWPEPLVERPGELLEPPEALSHLAVDWARVPMSDAALTAKRAALGEYRSQVRLVGRFFRGFVRRGELFSRWSEPILSAESATVHLNDPVRDRWGRSRCGSADIEAISVELQGENLAVRVRLRGSPRSGLTYLLHWVTVDDQNEQSAPQTILLGTRSYGAGTDGRELRAELLESPTAGLLMLGGEVWGGPMLLDRTPWRAIRLEGDVSRRPVRPAEPTTTRLAPGSNSRSA